MSCQFRTLIQIGQTGQSEVSVRLTERLEDFDLSSTLFLVCTTNTTQTYNDIHTYIDLSDGLRKGWYDSSRVRGE